ncbi:MAG: GtrA family protein [Firmicutes bacterium]|nr:GtrA family protein [Bacillota bacterium]
MSTEEVKKDEVKKQSELISYAIFGVATTVVSMVVYGVCNSAFEMHYLISNIVSWVIAVAFAYITNKMFVFKTRGMGFAQLKREITLFVSARLASLGIEELGLFILIGLIGWGEILAKLVMQVVVIVLNYIFSKLVIFKK